MAQLDLQHSLTAAKALLGYKLIHASDDGLTSGYIVETEAYHATDEASHSFKGKTKRTAVMFGPAGRLYVYFTYGMHYCINVVTGPEGSGEAVLIRALQPLDGQNLMILRRGFHKNLTNGPGRLTQAMGIDTSFNGENVLEPGGVWLEPGIAPRHIVASTRIGISKAKDKPWRFYIADNPYVSKR
jgi:DNA-3-methyladenine glycosylase